MKILALNELILFSAHPIQLRIRWKQCLVNGRALLGHRSPFTVPLHAAGSIALNLVRLMLRKQRDKIHF